MIRHTKPRTTPLRPAQRTTTPIGIWNLGAYLTGLWEGDGSAGIRVDRTKVTLHVTMDKAQAPYLRYLHGVLTRIVAYTDTGPVGCISVRTDNNSAVLHVTSFEGIALLHALMAPHVKTPKGWQLNAVLDWLESYGYAGRRVPRQLAPFELVSAWFAGFCDADGSFGLDKRSHPRLRCSCQFQLNQRRRDRRSNASYGPLWHAMARTLHVRAHSYTDPTSGRPFWVIKATSRRSKDVLQTYFQRHPLYSSKRNDYDDWCRADSLLPRLREHRDAVWALAAGMNRKRTVITWRHLDCDPLMPVANAL